MQNVAQGSGAENPKIEKVNVQHDLGNSSSTLHSTNSSPAKSETETYSEHRQYMSDSSESEEDSVSEVESFVIDQEFEEDPQVEATKFLLSAQQDRSVDPETQARLEALLQAAGIGQLATKDGKHLADPEVLRRLTSSVSSALDEAAAALTRMRSDNSHAQPEKPSLVEACTDGDVTTVQKLLKEGRSVHETSEEGESLLSLACSAGYFELAQVLLAMHANVEDRGIKGECTPLMEAASAGHLDIVQLLVQHGADVNAQSTSGNTPLMYGCAGGHHEVVKYLLDKGANVEDHNENGHTPLMEAASAGHVGLAKILLNKGAGINTHSNEFKESALTLACYKGHLDMVKFLLEAGADQEHKTDEMHTALMEASMDGHVEVARLLLDSGAQVNMPTDSFESPLTLAACGGHVDLAMLLIERGANIEEVNDEGYTPLMEAAREGHEDMVALLLSQGANINAQTDETQETALTLACCGGFPEVADFLIKAGADIELGASTPLMEAAQEGHLDLVKYLLEANANVHAQTQTGDTALTYACENGHTDVADLLLQFGADLEHESEGGRTPLMKACRAGHLCTVQFLISKGANVRRQTTNNDHTPLSLACAGGHLPVVELLLSHQADPNHKLKDNSTMLIEAAKGGHTNVVQLLLDYPHSMLLNQPAATTATNLSMLPGQVSNRDSPLPAALAQPINVFSVHNDFSPAVLQEVPEAVPIIIHHEDGSTVTFDVGKQTNSKPNRFMPQTGQTPPKEKKRFNPHLGNEPKPFGASDIDECNVYAATASLEFLAKQDPAFVERNKSILDFAKSHKKDRVATGGSNQAFDESGQIKQQIFEDLHRLDREFLGKQQPNNALFSYPATVPQEDGNSTSNNSSLPHTLNIDIAMQQQGLGAGMSGSVFPGSNLQVQNAFYTGAACLQPSGVPIKLAVPGGETPTFGASNQTQPAFYFAPLNTNVAVPLTTTSPSVVTQPVKFQQVTSHVDVSQSTAISDRPKAKPVSKKEGKNLRKQQQQQPYQQSLYSNQQVFNPQIVPSIQEQQLCQQSPDKVQEGLQGFDIDLDTIDQDSFIIKDDQSDNLLTASILQQFHNTSQVNNSIRAALVNNNDTKATQSDLIEQKLSATEEILDSLSISDASEQLQRQALNLTINPYATTIDENVITNLSPQEPTVQSDVSRVEYFAVPNNSASQLPVQVHPFDPYEHYLQAVGKSERSGAIYKAGFQAGISLMQQTMACPNVSTPPETLNTTSSPLANTTSQVFNPPSQPCVPTSCGLTLQATNLHHCQIIPCGPHQQNLVPQQQLPTSHQVQAATQTPQTTPSSAENKKASKSTTTLDYKKKGRLLYRQQNTPQQNGQTQQAFQNNPNYQIDQNSGITQYGASTANQQAYPVPTIAQPGTFCMDVDSETESNHDTALTLACAGGHIELVDLLIARGADIEHRDKKGFTPLILAATAGHEKVVEILLNQSADIEAQSERTKDTPLSLACSGGRYEVVEILLNRNANKEHRNVSDYTPLSLAASGGYVNIIKLLLNAGAEINSRTGSKLGISPLMLAAMNGHTAAVKLLLDMGSDINAQIETNRNTALTLACFQGRHEVVSLLLDRKANVEHRAKTGLTPLMEAASGGYVEVGRVLLDKGADVNAPPVPSSRDTALTIAADKGHVRFVELLLCRGAAVEVKNKKGNSPLWLAANGGHLSVVELLYNLSADIDSQDNRKVSCLMAAFRKGHTKVVKWMVNHVTQFPSDQEMVRYNSTVSDKEMLEKCQECVKIIRAAKETQAAKANKNASILLEELDMEKNREESKKAAAARRRERKKKKKLEKKEEKRKLTEENKKNEDFDDKNEKADEESEKADEDDNQENISPVRNGESSNDKEEGDSGIDANSQGSCSSNDVKSKEKRKDKKKKKNITSKVEARNSKAASKVEEKKSEKLMKLNVQRKTFDSTRSPAERDDFEATGNESFVSTKSKKVELESTTVLSSNKLNTSTSPKQSGKREEGWKEVVRKSSSIQTTVTTSESGVKKVSVPLNAISRVIGRGGSNINAIRGATGAHIEVEKQSKGQGERIITIKGTADATKQAHSLIAILIRDPDVDILQMLPKATKSPAVSTTLWDKTQIGTKKVAGKVAERVIAPQVLQKTVTPVTTSATTFRFSTATIKPRAPITTTTTVRASAPRLASSRLEKNIVAVASQLTRINAVSTAVTTRTTTKIVTATPNQTFAAKLTEVAQSSHVNKRSASQASGNLPLPMMNQAPISPHNSSAQVLVSNQSSPKHHHRPIPTSSAPPNMQHFPTTGKAFLNSSTANLSCASSTSEHSSVISQPCSPTPINQILPQHSQDDNYIASIPATQVYSLFNTAAQQTIWRHENELQKPVNFAAVTGGNSSQQLKQAQFMEEEPPPVDVSKAPGYKKQTVAGCSPGSSKASSNSTTPPNLPSSSANFHNYNTLSHNTPVTQTNQQELNQHYYNAPDRNMPHLSETNLFKQGNYQDPILHDAAIMTPFQSNQVSHMNYNAPPQQQQPNMSAVNSRLNPKAPDFLGKNQQQMYNGFPGSQNTMYPFNNKATMLQNFQRTGNWPIMPMQQPFSGQNDFMEIAGQTISSLARATEAGGMFENGDLGNNLLTMSPNLAPGQNLLGESHYEDRKPQPIGTGRAKKTFNPTPESWVFDNEKHMQRQWPRSNNLDRLAMPRINPIGGEEIPHYIDNPMHGPGMENIMLQQFYYPPQAPMGGLRQLELPPDLKMESWGEGRPNLTDIQDKQQGWSGLTHKWNP